MDAKTWTGIGTAVALIVLALDWWMKQDLMRLARRVHDELKRMEELADGTGRMGVETRDRVADISADIPGDVVGESAGVEKKSATGKGQSRSSGTTRKRTGARTGSDDIPTADSQVGT